MASLNNYIKKHPDQWHIDFFSEGLNQKKEEFLRERDRIAKDCGLTKIHLLTRNADGEWYYGCMLVEDYLVLHSMPVGEYYQSIKPKGD